jgi:hypothetical protein
VEAHYDLQNGRYLALGMNNQEGPIRFDAAMAPDEFTPDSMRRAGRR